ncbi:tRNA1(Val) (adenine(37)-N6)-methyltransferase [Vibrio sp. TRT 21S02]|uniref:tRNA1(Val) (adenine(37)-N6)-methyltransferase n=1 Tax=Vibrio sp. TRT 21S02 TaxID=3418507 RepID=UPI003CF4D9C7
MKSSTQKTKSFSFKQFKIDGGCSGMPVSTDGVLLGAWVDIKQSQNLLDIGTGTGLLALMCAQRNPELQIEAIDIEENAYHAAANNFRASPWHERLTLHFGDILDTHFPHQFDRIVCNPPYFNSGEQAQSVQRAIARHTDQLPHHDLLTRCQSLLTPTGTASFVLPVTEGELFYRHAFSSGWSLKRLLSIKPTEKKPINRLLIELSLAPCQPSQRQLLIRENGQYSAEFIHLTQAFYLKM